ncbi:MAG: helix-turn-helix domain-containing protein [Gemmatimonadota bacterium]|nr:MAG: helix-turn-helix domain-containing protein [Gemmatimonadota bacterium]
MQQSISIIDRTEAAAALLSPVRMEILRLLREPDSAAGVARRLDLPRQRVSYHVRALKDVDLLWDVGERRKGNFVEKLVQSTGRHYLIAPQALGELGAHLDEAQDRFSSAYLVGMVSEAVRDVCTLRQHSKRVGKKLATLSLETEVHFLDPAAQNAFAEELATCMTRLTKKYDHKRGLGGRSFRFMLAGYPALSREADAPRPTSRPTAQETS